MLDPPFELGNDTLKAFLSLKPQLHWTSFETLTALKDLRHLYIRIYFKYEAQKAALVAVRCDHIPPWARLFSLCKALNRVQRGLILN